MGGSLVIVAPLISAELEERLVKAADALHRRGGSLEKDDLRQIARECAWNLLVEKPDSTPSYVLTAARWRILDTYRKERRRSGGSESLIEADEPVADDFADSVLDRLGAMGELHRVALRLIPEHQLVVLLLLAEGLSSREISERLAIPLGTVTSRTARARETLRARAAA